MGRYRKATEADEKFINRSSVRCVVIERGLGFGKIPSDSVQGRVLARQRLQAEENLKQAEDNLRSAKRSLRSAKRELADANRW